MGARSDRLDAYWIETWREHGQFVRDAILAERASGDPEFHLKIGVAETPEWQAKVRAARFRALRERPHLILVTGGVA